MKSAARILAILVLLFCVAAVLNGAIEWLVREFPGSSVVLCVVLVSATAFVCYRVLR